MLLEGAGGRDAAALGALLERGLTELGSPPAAPQVDRLARLVLLLSDWAPRINLTGHRDLETMAIRLVLDAAAMASALPELKTAARLADLGSGAGFPGLPLAILYPQVEVLLVESRLRRHHFQRAARRELGLDRVEPIHGRADRIEPRTSDIVVAQAMAKPAAALGLMLPWARSGGILALPASVAADWPPTPDRIDRLEERLYRVPESSIERKLWVGLVRSS